MTVEIRPRGARCNLRCNYCYQNAERDAGHKEDYSIPAMKASLEKQKKPFFIFGGEPLMVPERDLEALWSWGLERFKTNGIQTNGVLLTENHIRLFKRYKVSVGISIDGPGELNDARWAGDLVRTRLATKKTEQAIERLCEEKIYPGLIVTLHRGNATSEKLPQLISWLRKLHKLGVRSARLHLLEVDSPDVREKQAISNDEYIQALLALAKLDEEFEKPWFDLFKEIKSLLCGKDKLSTCVWRGCDSYTTSAVQSVGGDGRLTNCGRTNKEGVDFIKSSSPGYERYIALYMTPQEHNGCSGCRYFVMCKGQCPGTAVDGDFRNRTEHCSVWKALFQHMEEQMMQGEKAKDVLSDDVRASLEQQLMNSWVANQNPPLQYLLERMGHFQPANGGKCL